MSQELPETFSKKLSQVLEKSVPVQLRVTKCTTIGPPGVGKTCLKRLLLGLEFDPRLPSTDAMEAPEWVEFYSQSAEQRPWKRLTVDQRQSDLRKTVAELQVAEEQNPHINKDEQQSENPLVQPDVVQPDVVRPDVDQPDVDRPDVDVVDTAQQEQHESRKVSEQILKLDKALDGFKDMESIEIESNTLNLRRRFVYFIDCGGQPEYHDVQPILITAPSVYLVVFNLEEYNRKKDSTAFFHQELIERPLRSIHLFASPLPEAVSGPLEMAEGQNMIEGQREEDKGQKEEAKGLQGRTKGPQEEGGRGQQKGAKGQLAGSRASAKHLKLPSSSPSVFIVGTHLDKIEDSKRQETLQSISEKIKTEIARKPYEHLLRRCEGRMFWPVDNTKAGNLTGDSKSMTELRKQVMKGYNDAVVDIPLKWMLLEVGTKCDDMPTFYGYEELFQLCKKRDLVMDLVEFDTMLYVFHTLGLFYFPSLSFGKRRKATPKDLVFTQPNCFYQATSRVLQMCCDLKPGSDAKVACPRPGVICNTALLLKAAKLDRNIDQDWFMELLADLRIVAKHSPTEYILPAALQRGKAKLPDGMSVAPLFLTFTVAGLECTCYIPTGILCAFISQVITERKWKADLERISHSHIAFTICQNQLEKVIHIVEHMSHIEIGLQLKSSSPDLRLSVNEIARVCHSVRKDIKNSMVAAWSSIYGGAPCSVIWGFQCTQHSKPNENVHIAVFESDGHDYLLSCSKSRTVDRSQTITLGQRLWLHEFGDDHEGTVMHCFEVLP